jgi:ceramide glucosyltransferase
MSLGAAIGAILACAAALSAGLVLWQCAAGFAFPLHRRRTPKEHPAVTVFKPLRGCDAQTETCLRSWLDQDYPGPIQILFGVASEGDPACAVVRRLLAACPTVDARLVICPQPRGLNRKLSTLAQLEPHASHPLWVVSDADVLAPRDLLAQLAAGFASPGVGLVSCLYALGNPATLAMRWEAVAINADFWSQVLQARSLRPLDFALGAVMAVRRDAVCALGGFGVLTDVLADDYQLGKRVAALGLRIELCPAVVECREAPRTWRDVWTHQLRWARTIRICQPLPYFASVLANATLWPALWALAAPSRASGACVAAALALRMAVAGALQQRLGGRRDAWRFVWLAPVKDLSQAALWALAFLGSTVEWRGERFRVSPDGRMCKSGPGSGAPSERLPSTGS